MGNIRGIFWLVPMLSCAQAVEPEPVVFSFPDASFLLDAGSDGASGPLPGRDAELPGSPDANPGGGAADDAGAGSDASQAPSDGAVVDAGCADSDEDGTDDCTEAADGDDWTDPAVFNGVRVRWKAQCSAEGDCSENDTRGEVEACMSGEVREERDQYAGWDWEDPPDDLCDADYGFLPAWSECDSSWQAQWLGFIKLESGHHCFAIAGEVDEGCGALYFDGEELPAQSGGTARCYERAAGVYPIMWHYTMDNGSESSLHVRHCTDAVADCTPSEALPARRLRPSHP